jgi:hypothetical protein
MVKGERLCANGSCGKIGKHLCSGCNEEIYCSKECHKTHWVIHKEPCQAAAKAVKLASFDSLSEKQLKNLLKVKAAGYEKNKKKIMLHKLDQITEKADLLKLVAEHVKVTEVESLLSGADKASKISGSSSSSSGSGGNKVQPKRVSRYESRQVQANQVPTPDQMRQQAVMIRKDPEFIRKSNVAFAKMSDDQIRAYADQLEVAAADPLMMKEVERMAKLAPADREQLQSIQEGLQGLKPCDDKWLDSAIGTLKTNPAFYKSMVKGKGTIY